MTRLIRRAIQVSTWNQAEMPTSFADKDEQHRVFEVIDYWREAGIWWEGELGYEMWRVRTDKGAVFDLEQSSKGCFIYRVWD